MKTGRPGAGRQKSKRFDFFVFQDCRKCDMVCIKDSEKNESSRVWRNRKEK